MRKFFYLLPVFLFLNGSALHAQVFGYPGATWVFEGPSWVGVCFKYHTRWEYVSDTTISGKNAKKVFITRKSQGVMPGLQTSYDQEFFSVSGDTVWCYSPFDSAWVEICNFSLLPGDTTYSPLRNEVVFDLDCDSAIYYAPAVVTDTGMQTIGGQPLRYYTVKYLKPDYLNDTVTAYQTWYERVITMDYWYPDNGYLCGAWPVESCPPDFLCYRDNGMITGSDCNDLSWFDNLASVEENGNIIVSVYPNPSSGPLMVSVPDEEYGRFELFSIDGKKQGSYLLNQQQDLNHLAPGIYLIRYGEHIMKWVKD